MRSGSCRESRSRKVRSRAVRGYVTKLYMSGGNGNNRGSESRRALLFYYGVVLLWLEVWHIRAEDTAKYLFALEDDHVIESVWMKYRHGNSVCISSQVGCRMGCTFCASTLTGLTRNLTAGEMLSQIYQIQKDTKEIGRAHV